MKKKILFISHEASLTGAPILLLNLINLIKEEGKYAIKIIVKKEVGALLNDFMKAGDTLVWRKPYQPTLFNRISKRLLPTLQLEKKNDKVIQRWIDESDIVLSNTITNGDFFKAFDFSKVSLVLSYIHELEFNTGYCTTLQNISYVTCATHKFLVPAQAVAKHLITNLNIAPKKISQLNYYIPFKADGNIITNKKDKIFTVGLIGQLYWRKGADILAIIMSYFFKKYPDAQVKFIWKGAIKESLEYKRVSYELAKLNLSNKILFEPPSKDVSDFFQSIDVLLLCSKEDPYPLVVLEAASYCKPCICFSDAGGMPEFVQDDAGDVVPYLDIESLAESIYSYYNNPKKGIERGAIAYTRYKALHLNKELILKQFENTFNV